jgi:hypothetical protein
LKTGPVQNKTKLDRFVIKDIFYSLLCVKRSSLVDHSNTGQICPIFEWSGNQMRGSRQNWPYSNPRLVHIQIALTSFQIFSPNEWLFEKYHSTSGLIGNKNRISRVYGCSCVCPPVGHACKNHGQTSASVEETVCPLG